MNRREFIRKATMGLGAFVVATTLSSFAWAKKVTPNPSLVDKLEWVSESDARNIVSAYREGTATPEEALPALFSLLDSDNNGFSIIPREVGRLRDFQPKEISGEKIEGLDRLVQLRDHYPDKFKETFEAMLKTGNSLDYMKYNGLPEKIFNPYVEALYWLALDGKVSDAESVVNEYLSTKLLIFAWAKPGDTEEEKQIHKERWGKLRIVTDRMSIPIGIDYYFDNYYQYEEGEPQDSTRATFSRKRGQCQDLAELGKRFLDYGGFNVFIRCVTFPEYYGRLRWDYHTTSGIIVGPDEYYPVVNFGPWGNKMGKKIYNESELDLMMAHGRPIDRAFWGVWVKPVVSGR